MRILIIVPYFGDTPPWIDYFLLTCSANTNFTWFLYGNMEISCQLPENVLFKKATLSDFNKLTAKKLKLHTAIDNPYKICDFRPAFGRIFEDNLSDFEFWGYSDLDLVYGNLSHFISLNNLKNFDIITSRSDYVAGHFTLFRNTNNINNLYKKIIGIRRILQNNKRHFAIDERSNLTGSPIENLADKHLGLKFFVKICRSILFRIYKTRIIQFDFNQVLNKEKKNKKLNICRLDAVRSDKYYSKQNTSEWQIHWENGILIDQYAQKELMYFHFLESKNNSNYFFAPLKNTQQFTVSVTGIR